MHVSYRTIIRKLSEQVALAEKMEADPHLLKQHISQAKLLCELILEEKTAPISEKRVQPFKDETEQQVGQRTVQEDLPGDSIFDF